MKKNARQVLTSLLFGQKLRLSCWDSRNYIYINKHNEIVDNSGFEYTGSFNKRKEHIFWEEYVPEEERPLSPQQALIELSKGKKLVKKDWDNSGFYFEYIYLTDAGYLCKKWSKANYAGSQSYDHSLNDFHILKENA